MANPNIETTAKTPDAADGKPTQPVKHAPVAQTQGQGRDVTFHIWRGTGPTDNTAPPTPTPTRRASDRTQDSGLRTQDSPAFVSYSTHITVGMVVLDAVHQIQAESAPDLACRWNCKAGKCGSCSAEINGKPRLMCMTRMDELPQDQPITIEPMKAFPLIKDLVTDVSWNYEVKKRLKPFKPRKPDAPDGTWRMQQTDVDRVQEFRKCIECFLCQDVCHVLRDHHKHDEFIGPRFFVYTAALEMHPLDTEDRLSDLKNKNGIGYCNITKCCTKVCPEHITITDNAIIPLKERVVDEFYDPMTRLFRMFKGK